MKIDLSKVKGQWKCPDCEFTTSWTYIDCLDGNPFCTDCDCDMELVDDSGEYDGTPDSPNNCQENPGSNQDAPEEERVDPHYYFIPMNTCAVIGTRVKYHKYPEMWENNEEIEKEKRFKMEDGKIYTVEHITIHEYISYVYLVEIPGIPFNHIQFEDVKKEQF